MAINTGGEYEIIKGGALTSFRVGRAREQTLLHISVCLSGRLCWEDCRLPSCDDRTRSS